MIVPNVDVIVPLVVDQEPEFTQVLGGVDIPSELL